MTKRKIAVLGANLPLLNFYKRAKMLGHEIHSFAWEEGAVCRDFADFSIQFHSLIPLKLFRFVSRRTWKW